MKHLKTTTKMRNVPLLAVQNMNAFARIMELVNSLVCQVAPDKEKCGTTAT